MLKNAWHKPLKDFLKGNKNISFSHSLEIGASECGTLAPFIKELSSKVIVGYFQCDVIKLNNNLSHFNIVNEAQYIDITEINGKYDLIIVKSVLGGIFREGKSSISEVNEFIKGHDNLSMFKNLLKYRHESKKQVCDSFTYFRGQI